MLAISILDELAIDSASDKWSVVTLRTEKNRLAYSSFEWRYFRARWRKHRFISWCGYFLKSNGQLNKNAKYSIFEYLAFLFYLYYVLNTRKKIIVSGWILTLFIKLKKACTMSGYLHLTNKKVLFTCRYTREKTNISSYKNKFWNFPCIYFGLSRTSRFYLPVKFTKYNDMPASWSDDCWTLGG